jgi:hemerythrin
MAPVKPDLVPHSLPIPFMNADHAREIRLLNEVEEALEAHRRGEGTLVTVVERLSVLAVHTREHFLREESLMRESAYGGYERHKAEHDAVLARMDAEVRRFREQGDAERLSRYLFDALPTWYANHQRTLDEAAAQHALERRGAEAQRL